MLVDGANEDSYACDTKQRGLSSKQPKDADETCSTKIQMVESVAHWDPSTEYSFKIATIDRNYEDITLFTVKLKFKNEIKHRIFKDYVLPDITVIVLDTKVYQNRICYSHIDPHLRTSDGYYYDQHHEGTFSLYYNKEFRIRVQTRTKRCYGGPTCACGINIQAGKDVFRIDKCGQINFIGFVQCGDGGILDVVKINDYLYKVYTPIGTTIQILVQEPWLNIDIFMAPKDEYNIEGLCGDFNGHNDDDLKRKDATRATIGTGSGRHLHYEFSDSWSLTDEESFFTNPTRSLEKWSTTNDLFCVCNDSNIICSPTQFLQCNKPNSVTRPKCDILTNKRRAVGKAHGKELERLNRLMQPTEAKNLEKREVAVNITADEALVASTTKVSGALVVNDVPTMIAGESTDEVISQCAYDVEVSDDSTLANVHVDALNSIAKNMLDLVPTFAENNTEIVQSLIANTCIRNCSNHGHCSSSGKCVCDESYAGSACSVDFRAKLNIDDIEGGGECDLADDLDCDCFYIRTDNLMSGFKCSLNEYAVTVEGVTNKVSTSVNTGEQEDIFTGICCVSSGIQKRSVSSEGIAVLYELSISNDGVTFSDTKSVYVFNSECQTLQSTQNGDTVVELKPNYCYIDGVCASNDTQNPSDDCNLCNTDASRLTWTYVCEENEGTKHDDSGKDGLNLKLIIGVVCGIVGAIVLVIVVVVVIKQCIKTRPKVVDTNLYRGSGNEVATRGNEHDFNNRFQSAAPMHIMF